MDRSPTARYSTACMRAPGHERRRRWMFTAGPSLFLAASLAAEEPPIQVNPNRPTFATPALTTQDGVAELEIGLQRSAARDTERLSFTPYLLKVGLLKSVELRVAATACCARRRQRCPRPAGSGTP